ncbi:MAG TPA: efflux RND transporter periplasmic adaptor subunit [Urbifossiella sp.]|nr:efflux RND transporter periplasmic adaptor subunit [Urbifossiella sp.]
MTPTTAPAANSASGGSENRSKYGRQIEEAFEAAGKLAGSNLSPSDFYQQFLNRTLSAIDAPAGAVWLRTPQGFLQIACQVNLDSVGLEAKRGGRQCHNEVLRQVFQAAPPRPMMLPPNERFPPNQAPPGPADTAGVPAANLTDYFALFAPIVTPEKNSMGVLEVFQDPSHDARLYPTFLNYAFQMAGYASQYHQFSNARAASGVERTFAQVEQFARQVHSSLNPTEAAYHVANEGRKLIECDRLCVGVRHARKRVTVEAVSGADVVEKASTHVRRLRDLMEAVLQWGETLTFKGVKDAGLPPDVSHSLDEYLNESQPKLLVVQPIRDEREKDQSRPARSVLVLESFNPPELIEPLIQRLEVVGKHAAPALYNAAQMKRVPLKFLWWPIAKVQDGLGGKARFYTVGTIVLLMILTAVMILVPYPLRMDAKGQLQPTENANIFAPREGKLVRFNVKPGDKLAPGQAIAELYDPQLEELYSKERSRINEAQATKDRTEQMLSDQKLKFEEKLELGSKAGLARLTIDSALLNIKELNAAYNATPARPGFFLARTGQFDPMLRRPVNASQWTVLNDDRARENLLGRTVKPSEVLQRVGNIEGTWQVELKIPQRNVGQIMRAFTDPKLHKEEPDTKRKYLDVDVMLRSMPDSRYLGRLYKDDIAAEAVPNKNEHDENEPVVTAYIKLNLDDIPQAKRIPEKQFVSGLEVSTRIRCGDHALGYSLFHGVWEWFYEKVVFFF